MAMKNQGSEKCMGVFWDIESFSIPHEIDITEFGGALVSYAQSFMSENGGSETSLLCVSQPSRALSGLQELGFEVITKHHGGDTHSLGVQMLLWLWDQEREAARSESGTRDILIVVVCGMASFSYIDEITARGVRVALVSNLTEEREGDYAELTSRCTASVHYSTLIEQSRGQRSVSFHTDNDADATPISAQREDSFNFSCLDMGGHLDVVGRASHSNSPFSLLMPHEDPPLHSNFDGNRSNMPSGRVGAIGGPINPDYHSQSLLQPQTSLESQGSGGSAGGFVPPMPPHQMRDYRIGGMGGPLDAFNVPFYEAAPRDVIGESVISTPEQRDLFTNLKYAFSKWNVKNAVSLLRKIYSKQTKYFKISSLIAASTPNINQLFETNENLAITAVNFLLSCVQWCMGVQGSGNTSESFKYKMNRNISRWLLKELQRQTLPQIPHPEIEAHAIAVASHVLRNIAEFDFALDILVVIGVRDPFAIIRPFIEYSNRNPDPVLAVKVTEFVLKHPEIHDRRSNSLNMSQLGAIAPPFDLRGGGTRDRLMSDDSELRPVYPHMADPAPPPSFFAPQKMQYKEDDAILVNRLIRLLQKSGGGALGARIPTLYREEYGDALNLRGRKLKDILTETNLVELIGADGPGDKLFKLIDSPVGAAPMRRNNTDGNFFPFERTMRDGIDPVRSKSGDDPMMKFW